MDETSVKCRVRAHRFRRAVLPRHDECALTFVIFFSSLILVQAEGSWLPHHNL